jgi:hypothetical protein
MRSTALAGLTVLLIASHAGAADPTAYRAVVTDPEVKLRAGPSDQLDETGTLLKGSVVIVEKEESNGWLAVTAPAGSVSWIATQFIEDPAPDRPTTPKNVFVNAEDEVTLAAGKVGLAQPLGIRRAKIQNGTILVLIGPKVTFAGKTWYPIMPPPGDVRYLPKTAVQYEKPAANNFAVHVTENSGPLPPAVGPALSVPPHATVPSALPPAAPAGGPLPTVQGPGTTPAGGVAASKPTVNHPLWTQAETAEREGRLADAEKAYFDLAALMNGPGGDHDVANLCYTRIHAIREKKRNSGGTAPGTSSGLQPPSRDERGVRAGPPQAIPAAGSSSNVNNSTGGSDNRQLWTGTLRNSVLTPDGTGKRAYALESSPGVVKAYVTASDGVALDKLVGKRVDVYGAQQTHNGLSKPYVIATGVEVVP